MEVTRILKLWPIFAVLLISVSNVEAQLEDICGASGGSAWLSDRIVYGRIGIHGFPTNARLPKITVTVVDRSGNSHVQSMDRTGKYCFRDVIGSGGSVTVELEGVQVARRTLTSNALILQHREDFDVYALGYGQPNAAATVSAKLFYARTEKNQALFEEAVTAEKNKNIEKAAKILEELTSSDPKDFIAIARLGSIQFERKNFKDAEAAYKRALAEKPDFSYAMMNLGRIYLVLNNVADAIKMLKQATESEPRAPRGFQLLGEAYLLDKKGTLGVEALTEALRLDPVGMAECHLLMARLYDRAGGKGWAAREYQMFLEKVPQHPDRKKFEKYINENPPESEKD